MTLTQLQYVLAVNKYRHFVTAAEKCFVTQPTLSMQIQKLEEDLGVVIFDRTKQPIVITSDGAKVIEQAKRIIYEAELLKEIVNTRKNSLEGELVLGIIPTLAPYLLPFFVQSFIKKFPQIILRIEELTTAHIVEKLKNDELDAAILATPLGQTTLQEEPLFYEPFVAYLGKNNPLKSLKVLSGDNVKDINVYLMQEGHCMRNQTAMLCNEQMNNKSNFIYESGSIETLKKMVDINGGLTFLPELSIYDLPKNKINNVRYFKSPEPVREISIVTHRSFIKKRLLEVLQKTILESIPTKYQSSKNKKIFPVSV
ncbi:MAG: LysR family transcriptional regulator [Bacteroidia bacterium]|nr:LysR family transcriptional regulator [Bacteroidia bacterium]